MGTALSLYFWYSCIQIYISTAWLIRIPCAIVNKDLTENKVSASLNTLAKSILINPFIKEQ